MGGYCKIAGMIDESMDTEQMKQPAQPWEFRSKPAWQRLLVMIGGVLMNFLLALFIYSMILYTWGDSYIALKDMTYGMKFNETAKQIGFRDGDILKAADGEPLERFNVDMLRSLVEAREVTVLRNGQEEKILMPEVSLLDIAKEDPPFVDILYPNVVDSVWADGGFAKAGIMAGDTLLAVNGAAVNSWNDLSMNWVPCRRRLNWKSNRMRLSVWFMPVAVYAIRYRYRPIPASRWVRKCTWTISRRY